MEPGSPGCLRTRGSSCSGPTIAVKFCFVNVLYPFLQAACGRACILPRLTGRSTAGVATTQRRRGGRVRMDAAALRRLRGGLPLTVRELAERSGVSYNTITMLENRHRTANPSTVRKLAAALGVEPRELMERDGG